MPIETNDLAAASWTWNLKEEPIESVNGRIHDGFPFDRLVERADKYVGRIMWMGRDTPLKIGARTLEIGSGTGYLMQGVERHLRLAGRPAERILGLDIAEHMLARARARLASDPVFGFVHYDGIDVPLPDRSLDLIYSVSVLQHIPKPYVYNLFFEIHRLLADGGFAVVQVLSFKHLPNLLWSWRDEVNNQVLKPRVGPQAGGNFPPMWHHYYSTEELEAVFKATGYDIFQISDDGMSIWSLLRR
ncbi:MAG TPA: class I SAM-dependent methyltransferase [Stellaceae bacterium]|nr:class I SAM-dependent methyltransferase [Stellaceae bacterium]